MRRLGGLVLVIAGCAVPPLTFEGKLCGADEPCPEPYKCVALETGSSICTTGCPPQSACAPSEGRQCSGADPCPSGYRCVRAGPAASVCTGACPPGVAFEPLELNCTDAIDNDCDGRVGSSRDVVLIPAPAEQPSWAAVSDGGYAAVYLRPAGATAQLQFQRFDPALVPIGNRIELSEPIASASEPLLVPLPSDAWAVFWLDRGAPDAGALTRVMFAKVGTGGALLIPPRVLGAASSLRGRPRAAYSRQVGSLLVLWIEGPSNAVFAVSLQPDGTILKQRGAFPSVAQALAGVTQLDLTDRVKSTFDAGFAAAWIEPSDPGKPEFMFVDREGDRLVGPVEMTGVGQVANVRAGNAELSGLDLSFFIWTQYAGGESSIWGRSSRAAASHFTLKGSVAVANVYQDLELAISTDNSAFNYIDISAVTADGSARVLVSKLLPGDIEPTSSRVQAQFRADGRAPAIAIGGGRHAFAYQLDAGTTGREIRAQLHCNPQ